ncbi:MAG TPA: MerR family transcriptional regulator [Burkholderiales bacterium]|nr:MerR family transcriptional regulator [Burkholderiales bacterium]
MKIGQLAQAAAVHVETIRYYQRLGLVPRPARTRGAVRRYDAEAASRLAFIKRAQALGFSLEEVKLLLELSMGEHCIETRTLARRKLALVEMKIQDLLGMQRALKRLIRACSSGRRGQGCPIIENLSRN